MLVFFFLHNLIIMIITKIMMRMLMKTMKNSNDISYYAMFSLRKLEKPETAYLNNSFQLRMNGL